jgi:hypothetical protein
VIISLTNGQLLLSATLVALTPSSMADILKPRQGETSVPPIYLMHYTREAPRDTNFLNQIRQAPPDILHLGHAVPLNSVFGPTADYSGFNPKLVPAEEILSRKEELRQFVARLHQAGVSKVIPYINPSILGGDHVKRQGFFGFYDHWEDYAALGLEAKPSRAPELWMQRERRSFAPWEPELNYPLWRYQPCPNEPAWLQYQTAVVRLIAECGYDGVFVDDCIMECRHNHCAERFTDFLQARYKPEVLQRVFQADWSLDPSETYRATDACARLRNAEKYLFWQNSIANLLTELSRVGRETQPDFFVVPSWGASARVSGAAGRVRSGKSSAVWQRAATWQLLEEDHPAGYASPDDIISYLLQHNYGLALGVRPIILSYGTTARQIELGYAEAAAGGGGAYAQAGAEYPEIRSKWRAFFQANRDLFAGFQLTAPVGLIFSFDEPRYANDEHLRQVFAIARILYGLHIPFAAVPAELLSNSQLVRHEVLIAPRLQHLSEAQLTHLESFVHKGGRLLIDSWCSVRDLLDLPRQTPFPGANVIQRDQMPPHLPAGQGGIFQISSFEQLVPQREFDVVDALDIGKHAAFEARIKEIAVQAPDRKLADRLHQWLTNLAGSELALAEGARDVHTVPYERFGDRRGSLIVHAVRYAAATCGGDDSVIKAAPVRLSVPLPPGWELERACVRQPEGRPVPVYAIVGSNRVRCELPSFEFYSMLELKLRHLGK